MTVENKSMMVLEDIENNQNTTISSMDAAPPQQQADAAAGGGGLILPATKKEKQSDPLLAELEDEKVSSKPLLMCEEEEQSEEVLLAPSKPPPAVITEPATTAAAVAESATVTIKDETKKDVEEAPFCMGDHVYQWCSVGPIPAVYQHHAIVLDAWPAPATSDSDSPDEWILQIADFDSTTKSSSSKSQHSAASEEENTAEGETVGPEDAGASSSSSSSSSSPSNTPALRVYESSSSEWKKVEYGTSSIWKRHIWYRSGTCTSATSDPAGLVRARVQFLLQHPEHIPTYHAVQANCECVAVWCKTGTWGTVQASSWLATTAAGQAKSAVTVASVAASTQVTVPASGLWGWLGYTTHASLLATQPLLMPAICAYGVVTVGAPAAVLWRSRNVWKQRTIELNQAFWQAAVDHPDVFCECIVHWSGLHD